jgi:hypothetical protein
MSDLKPDVWTRFAAERFSIDRESEEALKVDPPKPRKRKPPPMRVVGKSAGKLWDECPCCKARGQHWKTCRMRFFIHLRRERHA